MATDRRRLLLALATVAFGGAAGCGGAGDDGPGTSGSTSARPSTTERAGSGTPTATSAGRDGTTASATDQPPSTSETPATTTPARQSPVAGPRSAAHHDPVDGFADPAPWLDDDTPVARVQSPTRSALADAVAGDGHRVVVFETSGTIDLDGEELRLTGDGVWLAGQTAPSPGVTLTAGRLQIEADDSVVQHLRVRKGDDPPVGEGPADAISTGDDTSNVVVDHCTAAWGADETLSVGYDSTATTVTNCLVAEPLRFPYEDRETSVHYGTLVGDGASGVALAGNVWAHASQRTPRLKAGTESVVANNVMYHFEQAVNLDHSAVSTIEGNRFRRANPDGRNIVGARRDDGRTKVYVADNDSEPATAMTNEPQVALLDERPIWPDGMVAMPPETVESAALTHAGARPADRSAQDRRVVEQVREGTGDYVDSQADVGGYPDLPANTHRLDVPTSGVRAWLRERALDVEPSA